MFLSLRQFLSLPVYASRDQVYLETPGFLIPLAEPNEFYAFIIQILPTILFRNTIQTYDDLNALGDRAKAESLLMTKK